MSVQVSHRDVDGAQVLVVGDREISLSEEILDGVSQQLLDYTVSIPPCIIVDLQHVSFFGSSFIETLFRMWNRTKATEGGVFVLSGVQPYCREILDVTHLSKVWPIYPDVEAATRAIKGPQKVLGTAASE